MPSTARITTTIQTARLEDLGRSPAGPLYLYAKKLGAKVETAAKRNASGPIVGVRTGNLRSSIHSSTQVRGSLLVETVAADAAYALTVHEGAGAYDIVPRQARVLAWQGPKGPAFAKRAHIPPRRARPFLTDALKAINT